MDILFFGSIDRYWRDKYISVNIFSSMKIVGATGLGGLCALAWALRTRLRNLNLQSQFSIIDSFRDIRVHIYDFLKIVGVAPCWNKRAMRKKLWNLPNSLALIVSEILAFIRTDGQADMARSIQIVILIQNLYTLWGRKRFLLPVTYFLTNLVFPLTIRVTGINCFLG